MVVNSNCNWFTFVPCTNDEGPDTCARLQECCTIITLAFVTNPYPTHQFSYSKQIK